MKTSKLKKRSCHFAVVIITLIITAVAMKMPMISSAAVSNWGYQEDGTSPQQFGNDFRETGFVLKKTNNGAAMLWMLGGTEASARGIKVQVWGKSKLGAVGVDCTATGNSAIDHISCIALNKSYPLDNTVGAGNYAYLKIATMTLQTGTAYGQWNPY